MASDPLGGLTPDQQRRLRDLLRDYESGALFSRLRRRKDPLPFIHATLYIAKNGGSAIAARSGDTPGSGEVTLYRIADDGDLESMAVTKTAFNLSTSTVAANAWLYIYMEMGSMQWLVGWEDCA